MERVTGIEPAFKAWEALILPLNYTRLEQGGLYISKGAKINKKNLLSTIFDNTHLVKVKVYTSALESWISLAFFQIKKPLLQAAFFIGAKDETTLLTQFVPTASKHVCGRYRFLDTVKMFRCFAVIIVPPEQLLSSALTSSISLCLFPIKKTAFASGLFYWGER